MKELFNYLRLTGYMLESVPDAMRLQHGDCRKLQGRRLRRMVRHAYEHVPMYRRLYDRAGVGPGDIRGLEDLHRLPIVTRRDLVDAWPEGIRADNVRESAMDPVETSGSSGTPVRLFMDRALLERSIRHYHFLRHALGPEIKLGLDTRMLAIQVTDPRTLECLNQERTARLPARLREKTRFIDAVDSPQAHLEALDQWRPALVSTYPSVLRNMALAALEAGRQPFQPAAFTVAGEVLDDGTRELIGRVFRSRVLNLYGATEGMGMVAMECPHGHGLHVQATEAIVEVLREGRPVPPGVSGRVVITQLRNRSCPLIRYDGLGDVTALAESRRCSCGSRLPLLQAIEGRLIDSLLMPDGRLVHPYLLTQSLMHVPGIRQFHIRQEEIDRVRVWFVPLEKGTGEDIQAEETAREMRERLQAALGEGVDLQVEPVSEIPWRNDRRRPVVESLVKNDGVKV